MTDSSQDDYGHENDVDRNYGERPKRGAKPRTINLSELARGGGGGGGIGGIGSGDHMRPTLVAKNLTNRVPGIAELLEADSEIVRDLSRRPTTQFNPRFLEQQRQKEIAAAAATNNNTDDNGDRDRRSEEREKIRQERHRQEMQQRSKFHKQAAKTGEEVKTTLEDISESMIARTNQLGTMVEQLRADLLEAQIEQQNLQQKLYKQSCSLELQVDRKMSWLLFASLFVLALVMIILVAQTIWPAVHRRWFRSSDTNTTEKKDELASDTKPAAPLVATADNKQQQRVSGGGGSNVTALDSSQDLSIGI